MLKAMQPAASFFELAKTMFVDAWQQRLAQTQQSVDQLKTDISRLERQINQLCSRIIGSEDATVISAYETKVAEFEKQNLIAKEKLHNQGAPKHAFEKVFELALPFLAKPWNLWASGGLHHRQLVL